MLTRKRGFYEKYVKRLLDIICALLAIVGFSWLYLILAAIVRVKMGSPVVFRQPRPGMIDPKTGRERIFNMHKFRTMAEQNAAIDAFAQERKLKVEDDELPQALGMGMSEANDLIDQAREAGQLEMLRQMAVRVKAMRIVVTECSCSYQMESAEEAAARVAEFQRMVDNAPAFLKRGATADASDAPQPSAGEQRGFKLV